MTTRIDLDGPDVDLTAAQVLLYQDEPFTGEAVEYRKDGSLWTLETYVDGYRDGPTKQWYPDGSLEEEGQTKSGVAVGEWREWHPNGQPRRRAVYSEDVLGQRILSEQTWDEAGNLTSQRP